MQELLTILHGLNLSGKFTIEGDAIVWYYNYDDASYDDEAADHLWSEKCEVGQAVDEVLPPGWMRTESWADNDSTGFNIVRKPHVPDATV